MNETQVRVVNVECVKVFFNTSTDSMKQEADYQLRQGSEDYLWSLTAWGRTLALSFTTSAILEKLFNFWVH